MTTKAKKHRQRGVVLILMAMVTTVVLAFLGLTLDVGQLHWTKVRAQTAADSAVLAALREQIKGSSFSTLEEAGRHDAGLNGFKHQVDGTIVTINRPPQSGPLSADSTAVEAIVARTVPAMLLRFLGAMATDVQARAVAKMGPGTGCIYALNKTLAASLSISGSTDTYLSCDAIVESTSSDAFKMAGGQTLYLRNKSKVGVVGGWTITNGSNVAEWPSGTTKLPVRISDPGDPFINRTIITAGAPIVSADAKSGKFDKNTKPAGNLVREGVYCGGLEIGDTGGETFKMNGLYVIAGGGFRVVAQSKLAGSNVTIYLTSGPRAMAGCTAAYDSFHINSGAGLSLTAPTSGNREGMLIFQDRGIVSSAEHIFNGGSTSVLNGAIYIPKSGVTFNGNDGTGGYLILVADTIKITGNSTFNSDYSTLERGSPVQTVPTLVE